MGVKRRKTTYRRTSEHYPSNRGTGRSMQWVEDQQAKIMGKSSKIAAADSSRAIRTPFLYRETTAEPTYIDLLPQYKRNFSNPPQFKVYTEDSNEALVRKYGNNARRIGASLKHACAILRTTGLFIASGAVLERGLNGNYVSLLPNDQTTEVTKEELDYFAEKLRLDREILHTPEAQRIGSFNSASKAEAATEIINDHIADIGEIALSLGKIKIGTLPLF